MSLYNALFGRNALSPLLLAMLGLSEADVARFRDCYLDAEGDHPRIAIYTRTGGNNREDYDNSALTLLPTYLNDEDDDFDNTYATYYFAIPEPFKNVVAMLSDTVSNEKPQDRFQRMIADLRSGTQTPETQRALNVGEEIFAKITTAFDGAKP